MGCVREKSGGRLSAVVKPLEKRCNGAVGEIDPFHPHPPPPPTPTRFSSTGLAVGTAHVQ
jgi:hypothetical protein